jgi:phosphoglycerate kinase
MTTRLPTIDDLHEAGHITGKRVLVRCDFNVPLAGSEITDDLRIRSALPTIETLLEKGARVILCSHLGRPKGEVDESLRLAPVGRRLEQLLGQHVEILDTVVGNEAVAASMSNADIILLENVRFEPGETKNDPDLAHAYAQLADTFVLDAFGSAHRAHASVVGVSELLPSGAGLLLQNEVEKLEKVLASPQRPYVAILGGAKVSDKLAVIGNLLGVVDAMCIGGAMAFTLLKAQGHNVGRSLVEDDRIEEVREVLDRAARAKVEILVPVDVVAADSPEEGASHAVVALDEIGDRMGVDIGPRSTDLFTDAIAGARTLLWNGPMGIFEIEEFSQGTRGVAQAVVSATEAGAYSVVGGGDSAAALKELGWTDRVSHLSTGGGASLELLEGKELPGIQALRKQRRNS